MCGLPAVLVSSLFESRSRIFIFFGQSVQGAGFQKNSIRKCLFQVPLFIAAFRLVDCFNATAIMGHKVTKGLVSKESVVLRR